MRRYGRIVGVALALACSVQAQWAPMLETEWGSQISDQERAVLVETLQLSVAQQRVLESLLEDHRKTVAQFVTEARAALHSADLDRTDPEITMADIEADEIRQMRHRAECADRIADLDREFFENVQLLLEPQQDELWSTFHRERLWRKARQFKGAIPASTLNLNEIIETLEVSNDVKERLAPTLEEYNGILEPLLEQMFDAVVRDARRMWQSRQQVNRMNDDLRDAMAKPGATLADYEEVSRRHGRSMQRSFRSALSPQVAVRQTNLAFVEIIAEVLPDDLQTQYRALVLQGSNPLSVLPRRSGVQTLAQRILNQSNLNTDATDAVNVILRHFHDTQHQINLEHARASEQTFAAFWAGRADRLHTDSTPFEERHENLELETMRKLQLIITSED